LHRTTKSSYNELVMGFFAKIGAFFLDIVETIVMSLAIFLMVYLFIAQPHQVKGMSMYPNFYDGDYILTDKISYRFNPPMRGDVIVFEAPKSAGDEFIKRIIGLPGDQIEIRSERVYVNGQLEPDNFLPTDFVTRPGAFVPENQPLVVPPEDYFVLGDNRDHSSDSREWGFVPRQNITGKAFFRYWPPSKMGKIPVVRI
jgi:signal peptidase I